MTVTAYCRACGAAFTYGQTRPGRPRRYLCDACRAENAKASRDAKACKDTSKRRKELVDRREQALLDDIRAADAAGMSYGKYMLLKKNQGKFQNRA